jgi:UDP-GlcNAc:undecaprenyl-phosphate GlcNAc-1-phosphate transferase
MAVFAAILIAPWLLALVLTPATIRFAKRHDFMDRPTERKAHASPVALLGGVAVYAAIVLGVGALMPFQPGLREIALGRESLGALALGFGLMLALGVYDDLYDMPWKRKLAGQVAIAALTFAMGFQAGAVELPFGFDLSAAAPISFVVTVLWIVGIANAFNLIDGMDGLASGVALITVLTVFLLANQNGATVPVVAALALSGAPRVPASAAAADLPRRRGALSIGY